MATKYEIAQVISRSRTPGKLNHAQITVNFQGNSVTRHIIGGVGRHPDDTVPALHKLLEQRLAEGKQLREHKLAAIAALQSKPKDIVEIMRNVAIEFFTGMTDKKKAELAAKMQREVSQLDEQLPSLQIALDTVRKEDPIMVNYV